MVQRIVVLRKKNSLARGWQQKSIRPAMKMLERDIRVRGSEIDENYHPVSIPGYMSMKKRPRRARGFDYAQLPSADLGETYSVRMFGDNKETFERLRHDGGEEVVGIYADPAVSVFPSYYCGRAAVGDTAAVEQKLGLATLRRAGLTGKKVRVAVVDTGVNGDTIPVHGGWAPDPAYVPGSAVIHHGTMVAYDVRIAAPDARILDFALLQSKAEVWTAFLSDAIAAYAELLNLIMSEPGPLIVNNSWGMYNRNDDAPIGSPENYSTNIEHPFNQIVRSLVAAGADVFFAAGNCGGNCPDPRCGKDDRGPGASIHGANSHPDVITVAATTVTDRRLGYSSQGPGGLEVRKPDLTAYSHFVGSGVFPADSGTSAACPVAAGVAAALRQMIAPKKLSPAQLKTVLMRTARDLENDGWDIHMGYGVIDAAAAFNHLRRPPGSQQVDKPSAAT